MSLGSIVKFRSDTDLRFLRDAPALRQISRYFGTIGADSYLCGEIAEAIDNVRGICANARISGRNITLIPPQIAVKYSKIELIAAADEVQAVNKQLEIAPSPFDSGENIFTLIPANNKKFPFAYRIDCKNLGFRAKLYVGAKKELEEKYCLVSLIS